MMNCSTKSKLNPLKQKDDSSGEKDGLSYLQRISFSSPEEMNPGFVGVSFAEHLINNIEAMPIRTYQCRLYPI